jgi:hypothetical protein
MQLPAGFRHQRDAALEAQFCDGVIVREIAGLAADLVQPQSDTRPLQTIFILDDEWRCEPDLREGTCCKFEKATADYESRPACLA